MSAPGPSSPPRLRPAVRAFLVDADDRLLLCRWHFEDPDGPVDVYGAPGGGIEPGEDRTEALRRELLEETGLDLTVEQCGPVVLHRTHVTPMRATDGSSWDGQEEWVHLVRVDAFDPRGELTDEQLLEEKVAGLAWHSLDEVRALARSPRTHVSPRALADVVERLLRDGSPGVPLEVAE